MKVLLIELWGLGDATLMTAALRLLLAEKILVTVLCKPRTVDLLKPSFPMVQFLEFEAPWTAFRSKYRLLFWPWKKILRTLQICRENKFDAAASVRTDPRDYLWMFLCGISLRIGFPGRWNFLLTKPLPSQPLDHRIEMWRKLSEALREANRKQMGTETSENIILPKEGIPYLNAGAYTASEKAGNILEIRRQQKDRRFIVGLHCGARITVRRWPETYLGEIVKLLRHEADFHLALFPDTDGYGRSLTALSDSYHEDLSLTELVADLAACDLLICNDSGPGHIAAALNRPVLSFFGPAVASWFRPYGENNYVVRRDICPFHPCSDYCRFPEPICLTELTPEMTWPEIRDWFHQQINRLTQTAS